MKAIKFFAITAMAAAMFTSCSSEDELSQSNYPSDNIIRITAGVTMPRLVLMEQQVLHWRSLYL